MFTDKILGIDIGIKNIKMALVKGIKRPQVVDWALMFTPSGSIAEGEIKDSKAIAEQIKKVIQEKDFKPGKMAICLNSPHVVVREMKLPALKDEEIAPAVEFDLSQTFPGIAETHSISFKVYSRSENSTNGIVCFCPRKIIDGYLGLASMIGIPLKYIDVNANCTAKTYTAFAKSGGAGEAALIVNIGHASSEVDIVLEHKLIISRKVSGGGISVDNLIANRFGISIEQAEDYKLNNYSEIGANEDDINTYIRLGYAAIEDQIRQTIDFYSYNKYKEPIRNIYLIGGGSLLPGVCKYFQEVFRTPVSIIKPVRGNMSLADDFAALMPAIGAALRED